MGVVGFFFGGGRCCKEYFRQITFFFGSGGLRGIYLRVCLKYLKKICVFLKQVRSILFIF